MTDTVRIIHDQLLELGIGRLGRRLMFVIWSPDTLKVSRGLDGVLITYNRGTDLYDVTEYHACHTRELANGVYAENLLDIIRPVLTARVTRAAGRNAPTREKPHTREPGAGDVAPATAPAGRGNRKYEAGMSHTRATSRHATCNTENETTEKEISPSSIDNNFISS